MIDKELLKQILAEQKENLLNKPSGIRREVMDRIISKRNLPYVVVLTGLRRSGKSTLLKQLIDELSPNDKYYYISFEDERLASIKASDFNIIYEALVELFGKAKTFFIDEIQNVPMFENYVRRFYDNGFKFYVTGSNARLLSREIGTKLTGRHLDIEVKPFSFSEYLKSKGAVFNPPDVYITEKRAEIKKFFRDYLTEGGMPERNIYVDSEILTNIYNDIVIRDIIARYNINDVKKIKELYSYIFTNCGQKFSFNFVKNVLNYGSGNTVRNHIHYLEETYLIRLIEQFTFSIKKSVRSEKKAYVIDNGIQKAVTRKYNSDYGWLLENYFAASLPAYNSLYYYSGSGECDFIYSDEKNRLHPIQITWELTANNRERQLRGLSEAMNELKLFKGYIFTFDTEEMITVQKSKIEVIPLWKWLITRREFE